MGLEKNNEQHYREVVDKFINPRVDIEMTTRDYVVRPDADNDTGAIIITLPPVADAQGRFYSIVCRNADAVNTITITDDNDSECWLGDIVFDGKCDRALFYSDGLCWHPWAGPGFWPGFSTTAAPGTSQPPSTAPPTEVPTTTLTTAVPTTTLTTAAVQTTAAGSTAVPTTLA